MAIIEKLIPGSICWLELATTDQAAAKQFYGALFGWSAREFPMGPGGVYTIFQLKDRDCAASYTLPPDMRELGIPPHWAIFIAVKNVDESTRRAVELGATALCEPFDVMDKGRMAGIRDPGGAVFCLWQEIHHSGIGIAGEPNSYVWADLNTPDREGAKEFYSGLFGWKFVTGEGKAESTYWHIVNDERGIGGIPPVEFQPKGAPPHWMIYYHVADCDASCGKATDLGAKTIVPPMTIEGTGRMAVLADPQGAVFALFQPKGTD